MPGCTIDSVHAYVKVWHGNGGVRGGSSSIDLLGNSAAQPTQGLYHEARIYDKSRSKKLGHKNVMGINCLGGKKRGIG